VIGIWQFTLGKNMEAANWVMAAGGLALIVFSAVQLHREARREAEQLAAADGRGSSGGTMKQRLGAMVIQVSGCASRMAAVRPIHLRCSRIACERRSR
jgi:hypothetical protein